MDTKEIHITDDELERLHKQSLLLNIANDAIFMIDPDTARFVEFNDRASETLGYSRDELLAMTPMDIQAVVPDKFVWQEHVGRMRKIGTSVIPGEHRRKDGTTFPVEVNVKFIIRNNKEYLVSVARNVTERWKSVERYKALTDTIPHGVIENDTEGVITFANAAIHDIYGFSSGEMVGKHIWDLSPTEAEREEMRSYMRTRLEKQPAPTPNFVRKLTKSGSIIDVQVDWNYKRDSGGAITGFVSVATDITERKRAEEDLKREKDYLEMLHNALSDIVLVVRLPDRTIEFINKASETIFGYTIEECVERTTEFLHVDAEHYAEFGKMMADALNKGNDVLKAEFTLKRKNGEIFPIEITTSFIKTNGSCSRLFSIIRDITEQKKAEALRLANQNRFSREMIETIPGIVYVVDDAARLIKWNKSLESITGYSEDEIKTKSALNLVPEEYAELVKSKMTEIFASGRVEFETELLTKDARRIPYFFTSRRFESQGRYFIAGVGVNIAERKQIESERQRTAKLESVSILAGGIAHDFNNLLTGILGNLSLAKEMVDSPDMLLKILTNTEKASLRATGLTQQLLTFAKGGLPVKETAHIAALVKDAANFALSGSNVKCKFTVPEDLCAVDIDRGQISQVISNLMINAVQAMPDGGIINISYENVYIDKWPITDIAPGRFIKISIKDSGIGMPGEHLKKIFDPYFTTKQSGSGLGLAISYSIIKKHGGDIVAESELGVGSTFHIYLPASQTKAGSAGEKEEEKSHVKQSARILVMDDEDIVRDTVVNILVRKGHKVDQANNGAEAIKLYAKARELNEPYDVLIMDLTVPGSMGGAEAIKKLIEIDPQVKAIVSSGYSHDPIMSNFRDYGFKGVIAKPYKVSELTDAISSLLIDDSSQ